MQIEDYFELARQAISECGIIISQSICFDARTPYLGYIKGQIIFTDSSELHFREYVDVRTGDLKEDYSYHYQNSAGEMIFRYDNTPHHPEVETHPHHKHLVERKKPIAVTVPSLKDVLDEIEEKIFGEKQGTSNP